MSKAAAPESLAKRFTDGTHRCCHPEETLSRISKQFPLCGITRLADITGLDFLGIPTFLAVRPNARSLSVSQGKGLTASAAKVSAAMEAIELFHAEHFVRPDFEAAFREFADSDLACDPGELPLHPRSGYDPELRIPWVKGMDLIGGKETYVPYDLVHCWYKPAGVSRPVFTMTSNGLASGNHRLEAISHSICEVVERDAATLWKIESSIARRGTRRVDLSTIDSTTCLQLLGRLQGTGVSVRVWDQTSDVGLPCFRATISEPLPAGSPFALGDFLGMGCHLSKEIALIRALTEAAQSRLTMISGARDDMYRSTYSVVQSRGSLETSTESIPCVDFSKLPGLETPSFQSDVQVLLSRLERAGFHRVILVDLTQRQLEIPVVRCIIPGMEAYVSGQLTRYGSRAEMHRLMCLIDRVVGLERLETR